MEKDGETIDLSVFLPPAQSVSFMGAGLAGRPPCLPHSQVLMGAGLAGRPPCLPHSQILMGAGLAGRPPCLPHSQTIRSRNRTVTFFIFHFSLSFLKKNKALGIITSIYKSPGGLGSLMG